jgi:hypothetical protein
MKSNNLYNTNSLQQCLCLELQTIADRFLIAIPLFLFYPILLNSLKSHITKSELDAAAIAGHVGQRTEVST